MVTQNDDPTMRALWEPREKPDPKHLLQWVDEDIRAGFTLGLYARLQRCHRTRVCWWAGKGDSGTKGEAEYGTKRVFPWPGAIDYEARLAEKLILEEVALWMLGWLRGEKVVRPVGVMDDAGQMKAETWRLALRAILGRMDGPKKDALGALELFANCRSEFGQGVMYVGWQRDWRLGRKEMAWTDVVSAMLAKAGKVMQGVEINPQALMLMMEVVREHPEGIDDIANWCQAVDPLMDADEARKCARAFARGEMVATYYGPVFHGQGPELEALVPFVEVFYPPLTKDLRQCQRITRMLWLSEAQVRTRAAQEGWDRDWTEKVLAKPGRAIDLMAMGLVPAGWELNGMDMGLLVNMQALANCGMYQIAEMWYWGVSKSGLPGIYRALLHSAAPNEVGIHECDPEGTGEMPFIIEARERSRSLGICSQGVPEVVLTPQLAQKKLMDSMVGQTELRACPPLRETMEGGGDGLRPGARIGVSTSMLRGGTGPSFMEVPDLSEGSLRMQERLDKDVDEYFLRGKNVDPDLKLARKVWQLGKVAKCGERILLMISGYMQKNLSPQEVAIIAGGEAPGWNGDGTELLEGDLLVEMRIDVAAVDRDMAEWKMGAITKYATMLDRGGRLDYDRLERQVMMWIDPDLADSALLPGDAAAKQVVDGQNNRIAQMMSGVPVDYDARVSNPDLRLQVMQRWMSVPGNVQTAQADPVKLELLQKEEEWLRNQITQYETNPMVGRALQTPNAPEMAGAAGS